MIAVRMFFVVAALALPFSLDAQDNKNLNEDANTRSVKGTVLDATGKPAPGAVVQLKDTKTLQIRSYITLADGTYHFAGLNTNVDYEVKADLEGKSSGAKTLSTFDSRKAATLDLKLKMGKT